MNIVIVNNLPRFPDTDRWDFELVRYEDFISHDSHAVSYIVNDRGLSCVTADAGTYDLYKVGDLRRFDGYRSVLDEIVRKRGLIDRIVVFSEGLQDVVSQLREAYAIPGNGPERNRLGRDKLLMKQKVSAAGLRVPRYMAARADQLATAVSFASEVGYPLILKPVDGQSSAGVVKLDDEASLRDKLKVVEKNVEYDLEEYIDGELFHVDGLVNTKGDVTFVVASLYVNTCLSFTLGAPLGAAMIDPQSHLNKAVCTFATNCIEAIGLKGCPFHLELFRKPSGELVFLEVGARVGGADVPYVIEKATGVNLFGAWLKMIIGVDVDPPSRCDSIGGWLMFPRPKGLPLRVASISDLRGTAPSLYRQLVPKTGDLIEEEEGYCSMQAGRFLFCADSADVVTGDMQRVINNFSITTVAP